MQPAAAQRVGGRLRLVPVALHDQVAAHDDLPHLAGRPASILVVDDPHAYRRRLAPGRGQAPDLDGIAAGHVLGLGQQRTRHRRLALAEDLHEDRAERRQRRLQVLDVHRRAAVDHGVQARDVAAPAVALSRQQRVDHGGHQEHRRGALARDRLEDPRRVERARCRKGVGGAGGEMVEEETAGAVGDGGRVQDDILGATGRRQQQELLCHRQQRAVRPDAITGGRGGCGLI